ncbi:hypothetical protein CLAFUW4_13441 [Fulvia fulva]|uniref:Uncharacterized protein n=1 Tax=Passalora fulva TaxID=5499 RepID=A0A9Q8PKB3_PASFU|nr:uncharacterized protein CLAFUR5_13295 [Fulvia fulva]KAK4611841.1 hypothetical protein CLAFUR4_13444 [Fulvia fulva]KAK4612959.1 hypothetical protein CLAFUR0_13452 [Fulvia fulva]UJO24096.1 hypothetical protein CLAFUR5_13295 [Fulvia fulva]WPV20853.1 hypothetical protein CLAFUW4_13441 [Fulvia fulva]WPV35763.1 hypothetical protein CLAFUW7_13448 [Fulvia fulva]
MAHHRNSILAAVDLLHEVSKSTHTDIIAQPHQRSRMPAGFVSHDPPAGLLTLPQELRDRILDFLPLVSPTGLVFLPDVEDTPSNPSRLYSRHNPDGFEAAWHYRGLTEVCRTLYHDVKPHFWSKNKFVVHFEKNGLGQWLKVPDSCLYHVRCLTIKAGPWDTHVEKEQNSPRQCTIDMTVKPLERTAPKHEWDIWLLAWQPPADLDPEDIIDDRKWTKGQRTWARDVQIKCASISKSVGTLTQGAGEGRFSSTINQEIVNGFALLRQFCLP